MEAFLFNRSRWLSCWTVFWQRLRLRCLCLLDGFHCSLTRRNIRNNCPTWKSATNFGNYSYDCKVKEQDRNWAYLLYTDSFDKDLQTVVLDHQVVECLYHLCVAQFTHVSNIYDRNGRQGGASKQVQTTLSSWAEKEYCLAPLLISLPQTNWKSAQAVRTCFHHHQQWILLHLICSSP